VDPNQIYEEVKSQTDVFGGPTMGLGFESLDGSELQEYGFDKPVHTAASFSLARATIKAADILREDPSFGEKAAYSFTAVTLAGTYKELKIDGVPDPKDMAANYAGWALAITYEQKILEDDLEEFSENPSY